MVSVYVYSLMLKCLYFLRSMFVSTDVNREGGKSVLTFWQVRINSNRSYRTYGKYCAYFGVIVHVFSGKHNLS